MDAFLIIDISHPASGAMSAARMPGLTILFVSIDVI